MGTGLFANALPDSGLGVVASWHFSERFKVLGLLSDSNADRYDFGDITEGDFYKAIEFGAKLFPRTEKAGYSKFTLWHTDGTKDGTLINGNTGKSGWGMTVKAEQELTADGNLVGIARWGKSWTIRRSTSSKQECTCSTTIREG